MRKLKLLSHIVLMLIMGLLLQNCTESVVNPVEAPNFMSMKNDKTNLKATGEVEIIWQGGGGENSPDVEKRAFADFNAHAASGNNEAKGEFIYRVCSMDLEVHREIIAEVSKVVIDGKTAWFMGQVVFDSKGCEDGDGVGGHSGSCSDNSSGGCGDDDTGHDGGCSGDDHADGGDSGDDHSDGGCSGDDHDDGGCSGDDHSDGGDSGDDHEGGGCSGDDHDDGGCSGDDHSGGGSGGHSSGVKGKDCRVGQYIFVIVYDGGTPGAEGDEIEWKWFPHLPWWNEDYSEWRHLCEKVIIGGNLVVHNKAMMASF